ncbi:MAG: hypothetical protein CL678_08530 [Bdellovibrionaceae bacterium]|nr:hypothetical protein [Pseudobdellovibrionaceae bacterium]|tara:strand:+ start:381 stop:1001 length:621 start_codon:yes stop_codon:yes gene_type:complete
MAESARDIANANAKISICNYALNLLGVNNINSFDEDNVPSELCRNVYDMYKRSMLQDHNWSFATKRKGPLTLANPWAQPDFQFNHAFFLPTGCIRVILATWDPNTNYVRPQNAIYQIEGPFLLSNWSQVYVKFISEDTDEVLFTPMFIDAFSVRLAAEMAMPLTNSLDLQDSLFRLYTAKVRMAANADGMQGSSQRTPPGSLVLYR